MELSTAERRSICLPTRSQADYGARVKDRRAFRIYLDEMIATYPELFPATIVDGYWLYGVVRSKKLGCVAKSC